MPRVVFDYGEVVRAKNSYTDATTGLAADPLTVQVEVRKPDGTITTYVYGVATELTKLSVGNYQMLITLSQAGTYKWRWTATTADGPNVDVDECDSVRTF